MMNSLIEYYNNIPYQLLVNAGLPTNFYGLSFDNRILFEFLLRDNAKLLDENKKLLEELDEAEGECCD